MASAAKKAAAQTFKNPARAAARGNTVKGGQPPGQPAPTPSPYGSYQPIADQYQDVADDSQQIRDQVIDYTRNNPYDRHMQDYLGDMLGGNMDRNPWEKDAYGVVSGINNPLNDTINELRNYMTGGNKQTPYDPNDPYSRAGGSPSYSQFNAHTGTSNTPVSGGVPDTVGGQNTFFAQKIKELFEAQRLDPMNDPTMRPLLDAMRSEGEENMYSSLRDMSQRAQGAGHFGSGYYEALMAAGRDEGNENLNNQMAQLLHSAREGALGRQMQGLDMTNTRDLGAMQDATNRYGIDASSAASGAGAAAAAADAAEGRRLQAMGMLLGTGSDLLGFQGQMANMRQSGQLQGLNQGLGFANFGLDGYRTAGGFDQNRLAALGGQGNLLQNQQNYQLGQQQNANQLRGLQIQGGIGRGQLALDQDRFVHQQGMDMMQMLAMLSGMGGTNQSNNPNAPPYSGGTIDPALAALMGGFAGWNAGGQ